MSSDVNSGHRIGKRVVPRTWPLFVATSATPFAPRRLVRLCAHWWEFAGTLCWRGATISPLAHWR